MVLHHSCVSCSHLPHNALLPEMQGQCVCYTPTIFSLISLTYYIQQGLQLLRQRPQARRSTDIKLIFVPLIFFLLRVWSALIDIPTFYFSHERHPYGEGATHTLVAIAVGSHCEYCMHYRGNPGYYTYYTCYVLSS